MLVKACKSMEKTDMKCNGFETSAAGPGGSVKGPLKPALTPISNLVNCRAVFTI